MTAEDTVHEVHDVAPRLKGTDGRPKPHVGPGLDDYKAVHSKTVGDGSDEWWAKTAKETLYWHRQFETVRAGSFENGDIAWFPEGGLNASYNCLDRWAFKNPDKPAIIYEADEPGEGVIVTYAELLRETCRIANVLKEFGVRKGDTVSIYLPMTWHAAAAFLACARIGAIHSVIFAGFSAESLRDRVVDCGSRVVITTDEGRRGGKTIATKAIVDAALKGVPSVEHVLVLKRTGGEVNMVEGRDKWWHEEAAKVPAFCPPEIVSSEDPLFILYTSGSTGRPKGVVIPLAVRLHGRHRLDHWAHLHHLWSSLNGVTTTVFESTPVYPTPSRYWDVVQRHKITQFYTSPTAIRLLRRLGEHHFEGYDLSTLRVLGSVGEPINPEAWHWYNENVGKKQCAIVDTFWQTETGSIVVTPLPGAVPTKPGSATVPFWGVDPVILDPVSGKELEGNNVEGVLCIRKPWPSIARSVYKDHGRYLDTYLKPYPGFYFTGDGAARDQDGYIWIKGVSMVHVINVSGHRLSTAEIESALIMHAGVAETAVIGTADELTGQAVHSFVTLKPEFEYDPSQSGALIKELTLQVRKVIGPFAAPKQIYIVNDLPKTRSGKIMRRVMRKIVAGEADQLGDLSTLADPSVVDQIKEQVEKAPKK
ncbi:AMP binding enzyme [Rhizoctonia solani]|uniref:acetate--CoA ligase n=1 Tax=Rhizoctonia solani TaxID=456999 RepID=A0A8H8P5W1_9AGAM|nr:AMP binding enzyme [Rhizoctonia solani]QRW26074.1 AMP binding enzyme [Rhizoctonia solani]